MFGTAATQRGRAPQLPFMISRSSSAVVEGSTVTSLSSGGGGATAVLQSEMTSAIVGEPTNVSRSAPAVKRETIMMSSLYLGNEARSRPESEPVAHADHTRFRPSRPPRVRAQIDSAILP